MVEQSGPHWNPEKLLDMRGMVKLSELLEIKKNFDRQEKKR